MGLKSEICGPKCGWATPFKNRAQKWFLFLNGGAKTHFGLQLSDFGPVAPLWICQCQGCGKPWVFGILPMGSGFLPKTQLGFWVFDLFQAMQELR